MYNWITMAYNWNSIINQLYTTIKYKFLKMCHNASVRVYTPRVHSSAFPFLPSKQQKNDGYLHR